MYGSTALTFSRVTALRFVHLRGVFSFLVLVIGCVSSQYQSNDFTNYTVYRVVLSTPKQVDSFLQYVDQKKLDLWRSPTPLSDPTIRDADIMVSPQQKSDFSNRMSQLGVDLSVFIGDVQKSLRESGSSPLVSRMTSYNTLSDDKYFRYNEIVQMLKDLRAQNPNVMRLGTIGRTYEGRNMFVVRLSQNYSEQNPAIWVDAGIHAREWIAPSVILQAIHRIVTDPKAADMLNGLDWYILPLFNPDGYEYTHTINRMWRKTRSRSASPYCIGVDANRNFGYYWKVTGASSDPCSDTYAGPSSFSEPETRNVRDFITRNKDRIKAYLTFHSYGNYLLYPWGYTADLPENSDELDDLAQEVNRAMSDAGGPPYQVGSSTRVLYPAAGGSDDWAKGVADISLSYTIELPGYGYGFQLPPSYINGAASHVFEGLRTYAKYVRDKNAPRSFPSDTPPDRQPSNSSIIPPSNSSNSPPSRQPSNSSSSPPSRQPSNSSSSPPSRQPSNSSNSPPSRQPSFSSNSPPARQPSNSSNNPPSRQPSFSSNSPPSRQPSFSSNSPPARQPSFSSNRPPSRPPSNPTSPPPRRPSSPSYSPPSRQPPNPSYSPPSRQPSNASITPLPKSLTSPSSRQPSTSSNSPSSRQPPNSFNGQPSYLRPMAGQQMPPATTNPPVTLPQWSQDSLQWNQQSQQWPQQAQQWFQQAQWPLMVQQWSQQAQQWPQQAQQSRQQAQQSFQQAQQSPQQEQPSSQLGQFEGGYRDTSGFDSVFGAANPSGNIGSMSFVGNSQQRSPGPQITFPDSQGSL